MIQTNVVMYSGDTDFSRHAVLRAFRFFDDGIFYRRCATRLVADEGAAPDGRPRASFELVNRLA